jgi:fructose-bisphosphate aldolase class II
MKNFNQKKQILERAQKEGWAMGQFNVCNLEILKAVFQAAKNLKSPVIVGTSEGESDYIGLEQTACLVRIFEKETGVPAILNLDHGKSLDYIKKAIAAGYDYVHFDGSKLPLSENIKTAKKVVEYARNKGVLVEGEVGFIKGSSEILQRAPEMRNEDLTDPKEADRFIKETKVDSLAVNIGAFHGMEAKESNPHVDLKRLKEIKEKIGDKVFLVLHGGSGVLDSDIKEAIRIGIVKININTELRLAFKVSLKDLAKEGLKEIAPYKYMPQAIGAVEKVVEEKIKLFNSNNKVI